MQNKCLIQKLLRIKKIELSIGVKYCHALPLNGKVLKTVALSLSSAGTDHFLKGAWNDHFSNNAVYIRTFFYFVYV